MPALSSFYGITIYMYQEIGGKHHFPHIHVKCGGRESVFEINEGRQLEGNIPKKEKKLVLAWIEIHKDELKRNWSSLNIRKGIASFTKIAPLK